MKNVKIHAIPSDCLSPPVQGSSFCTDMVSYDDYKKLEGMFIDVASENALLKKFIRESCYVFDGEQSDISDAYTPADQSPLMPGLEATKKFSTEMMVNISKPMRLSRQSTPLAFASRRQPVSGINYQALREAAQNAKDLGGIKNYKRGEQAVAEFESLITPHIVLALLDEIKKLEDTNIDAMCQIAELKTNVKLLKEGVTSHD